MPRPDAGEERSAQISEAALAVFARDGFTQACMATSPRKRAVEYFEDYRAFFAGIIQAGIARGEFRPIDPTSVATTLLALFEGLALLWVLVVRSNRL